MNVTLRQAIVKRVEGKSEEELKQIIEDSIGGEEQVLPGLGVLFERIWQNGTDKKHDEFIKALKATLDATDQKKRKTKISQPKVKPGETEID